MKKADNSSSLVKLLKTIFKPMKPSQKKDGPRKRERWMYRNE
ncbi:MAG: hypothetical protein AB8F94_25020 [Saprospiraceae bacterium]